MIGAMSQVEDKIDQVKTIIRQSAERSGRTQDDIKLLVVTKNVEAIHIAEALNAGVAFIGENYVQEAAQKKELLQSQGQLAEWHMIGRLQTNKARTAVRLFDMIQSLDRIDLAREINRHSLATSKVTRVLIEVNAGGEQTKGGISLSQVIEFIKACSYLENISIRGLMTIPPFFDQPDRSRPYFARLRDLSDEIRALHIPLVFMEELSMGMTNDYPVAIEEGATMVRIGRGIFGERQV
jgi:PLP dependent protein